MTDLLDAALRIASTGTPVFPVNADKTPKTKRGFHDATIDEKTIRNWNWNGGGGIGAAIVPGQIVIDVDPRNGGSDTLRSLREHAKTFPKTRVVRTGGGGFHYYFTVPDDREFRSALGPGIDVKRAGKGYVLVPPTKGYRDVGGEIAPAPEWLLEELLVEIREGAELEASDPKFFEQFEEGTAYGLSALEREMGRLALAQEGERNQTLNRVTFVLAQLVAGGELSEERVRSDLLDMADRIGLDAEETRATIESGFRAGVQEPRQAPPLEIEPSDKPSNAPMPQTFDPAERKWQNWDIDEPAPPFFLNPIIPKSAYITVYGATEASKSMVWVALLAEASRRRIKCSVYSLENPSHTDRHRLRRLKPNPEFFRLTNDPLDLNDPRQLMEMLESEKEWGADLIFIDTYSHAFNSRSEDGNAKAIEFARRVRWLMHELDCTVIVADHTGYTQSEEPRDASAKRQQVDVAIYMEKRGEWQPGQSANFMMKNKKAARFANPFMVNGEIQDTKDGGLNVHFTFESVPLRWEQ